MFYELMDQKNHHKIPLHPPFPKGDFLCLPLAKGGGEGFYKHFQTAKVLQNQNFQQDGFLRIYTLGQMAGHPMASA
jgi:hypothetical protein